MTSRAVTKADLVVHIHETLGVSMREAKSFVDAFFEEISRTLENNEGVKLAGFGSFVLLDKTPRPGRNPKTGEAAPIAARRVVAFRASRMLRKRVNPDQ